MPFKSFFVFISLLVSSTVVSADFRSEVGIGLQYGGVIGWQGSLHSDSNSVSLSVGLLGVSLGYEYAVSEKVSMGVQGFAVAFAQGGGANINYHFTTTSTPGWLIGVDLFDARSTLSSENIRSGVNVLLSAGYKF